ncbi:MAG: 23S rRNA (adenine(2503)-C(2))-methyltransferase RlmN [Pseudomonadales bacterium]|nr:23S rRNA (adenine(2503)-C(2))-methyltransferase RlmN [Pseudomonadales bacterium]
MTRVIASSQPVQEGVPVADYRVNLLGLTEQKLTDFFLGIGEKKFRAIQVMKWIHHHGVDDFSQMSNLSKALREKLQQIATITAPEVLSVNTSADGTRKWLIRLEGGSCIETVFIPGKGRGTLCVSSQIGCSLDCSFCATGKQGFNRDLEVHEIVGQLWLAARSFDSLDPCKKRVITNVVMMGMGEPLLNFDNVVDAVNLMMADNAYGLSKRRVTLSTSGLIPEIDKLGDRTDVSLAVSLHAPNDELRNTLVPINRRYPINDLLAAVNRYLQKLPDTHRRATIEYTLIDGVNDSLDHAKQLAEVLRVVPCKINLIPFNPFPGTGYKKVKPAQAKKFQEYLINAGYITTQRTTRGDDIDAACGQLAGAVNDKTSRSRRFSAHQATYIDEPIQIQ